MTPQVGTALPGLKAPQTDPRKMEGGVLGLGAVSLGLSAEAVG